MNVHRSSTQEVPTSWIPPSLRRHLWPGGVFALATMSLATVATAQRTVLRANVSSAGNEAGSVSDFPSISSDGRRVVFESFATNLVPGDTNASPDVFVHDRVNGLTLRASVDSSGNQATGGGRFPAISGDGLYAAYTSGSANLVSGDTNGCGDVFVYAVATGQCSRVSVDSTGVQGDADSGPLPHSIALSTTGRYVAFASLAGNLVLGDTNDRFDVFVHDRVTGSTTRASVTSNGQQGDDQSGYYGVAISGDGRYVAFVSDATNLVAGDTNARADIFVHDMTTGQTTRVSVSSLGVEGDEYSDWPSVSADGRYVGFQSFASTLVPGDTNGKYDVFVRDLLTGQTTRASEYPPGTQWPDDSRWPSLSADGRHIAYSVRTVPGGPNPFQVVVDDLVAGTEILATVAPGLMPPAGNGDSSLPSVSSDGAVVAFRSDATNLVLGDSNGLPDIYVVDMFAWSPTIATYCVAGTTTHGCTPSMTGAGNPRNGAGSGFTITVSGVEGNTTGMIFYGLSGAKAVPFGAGSSFLCVRSPLQRTPVQASGGTSGACDGSLTIDWNQFTTFNSEVLGWGGFATRTVWAQAWFRDALAPGGSNLSNALWFTVLP